MKNVLKGVENHLSSPIKRIQILGMFIGEVLINNLNNNVDESRKLKFNVKV
jgi:hypothetical protein